MKTIFLSIGHNMGQNFPFGPKDKGAVGNGTNEFDVVKKIVDYVWTRGSIRYKFAKVPEGLNLKQRIAWINKYSVDGDICIEFHLDSGPSTARGASVWYMGGSEYAKKEGGQFLQKYTEITGLPSRHVKPDNQNRLGSLGFIRETKPVALLVELGFISNSTDLGIIRSRGIDGVIAGIQNMLGQ